MKTLLKHWNNWGWIAALLIVIIALIVGLSEAVKANEAAFNRLKY